MHWLKEGTENILRSFGLDPLSPVGGSVHFFVYDLIKILLLLCSLIFIISFIQSYFPPQRTKRILSRFHGLSANILSALMGTVTPFCSCSSIPLFMGFAGAGLGHGVIFSFLISSPMVDLGSLVLLTGIFGYKVAIIYVCTGLLIAVAGGTLIEKLHMEEEVEDFIRNAVDISFDGPKRSKKDRALYALRKVKETLKKVFPYLLAGVLIGSIIHNWIPTDTITALLGKENPLGVILATLVGVPIYADIFGTVPVAEALFAKGAQLGTVIAFMMAVTTLSLPSMIMLKKALKPKLLAVFILICTIGIIIDGYFFNLLENWIF